MDQDDNFIRLEERGSVTTIEETDQIYAESTGSADGYLFRTQFTVSVPSSEGGMSNSDEETVKEHDQAFLRRAHSENSVHYQCQVEKKKENASLGSLKEGFVVSASATTDFKEETEPLLSCPDLNVNYQKIWEEMKCQELTRLKDEIHQLRSESVATTEALSEAQDIVARLKEQELSLRAELDSTRQRAKWSGEMINSLQQKLTEERAKLSGAEEAADKAKRENRRLEREVDYLKTDLATAEKDLNDYKLGYKRLQNEIRELKNQLGLEKNRTFTLKDEKQLLSQEIIHLRMNLDAASQETRQVRHANNKLQDKIQSLKESRQSLQSHMQSIQGQFSKELNSLRRQLHAAKEQANLNKVNSGAASETELRRELREAQSKKCDELQKDGYVRQTVRSRSTVRSVVSGGNRDSREDAVRKLHEENRLLRMNMKAVADLINDD